MLLLLHFAFPRGRHSGQARRGSAVEQHPRALLPDHGGGGVGVAAIANTDDADYDAR